MNRNLPIVLVGGWGLPVSLISPLVVSSDYSVTFLALDQVSAGESPVRWLERQITRTPERAIWIGWSLGGQLAMLAADLFPARVIGVATLCSSPCFVAKPDWPGGMIPGLFDQFLQGLRADPFHQWQRFVRLQVHGDRYERESLRSLAGLLKSGPEFDTRTLISTLEWLAQMDQRSLWRQKNLPRLHLWGDRDPVCVWHGEHSHSLLEHAQTSLIPEMAHWPGDAHASVVAPFLAEWLAKVAA